MKLVREEALGRGRKVRVYAAPQGVVLHRLDGRSARADRVVVSCLEAAPDTGRPEVGVLGYRGKRCVFTEVFPGWTAARAEEALAAVLGKEAG